MPPPVRKIETKDRAFLAAPRARAVTALPEPSPHSLAGRAVTTLPMPEPRRFLPLRGAVGGAHEGVGSRPLRP
jgi:hypothetical protein